MAGAEDGLQRVDPGGSGFTATDYLPGLTVDGFAVRSRPLAVSSGGAYGDGHLYIGDWGASRVIRVPLAGGLAETIADFPLPFSMRDMTFAQVDGRETLVVSDDSEGVLWEVRAGAATPEPSALVATALGLLAMCAWRGSSRGGAAPRS